MKIAKWVAGVLIGVLALGLLVLVTLTLLIDPNRFRGQIEGAVQDATGRPFSIRGDLDIAWFPWLAVRTGEAELGNPDGIAGPPLARWKSARVGVRLIPLLRGELMIDRVRFEGLQANLKRMADGRANWDGLLAKNDDSSARKRPMPQIAGIEIQDGALDYVDERSSRHYRISEWDLDVGAWKLGVLVPVSTELQFANLTGATPAHSMQLELDSQVRVADKLDRIELRAMELKGRTLGGGFPEQGVIFQAELPQLAITLQPFAASAPDWRLKVADAELAGSLTVETSAERIRARGPLSMQVPSVRELVVDLGIDAPVPKDTKVLGPLKLQTAWAFVDGAIALKPITLQLDDTTFKGEVLKSSGEQAMWTFDLRGDRIDLQRYVITEDTSDEPFELPVEALRALRAQGTLAFNEALIAGAQMKNARLRVLMAEGQLRARPTERTARGAP